MLNSGKHIILRLTWRLGPVSWVWSRKVLEPEGTTEPTALKSESPGSSLSSLLTSQIPDWADSKNYFYTLLGGGIEPTCFPSLFKSGLGESVAVQSGCVALETLQNRGLRQGWTQSPCFSVQVVHCATLGGGGTFKSHSSCIYTVVMTIFLALIEAKHEGRDAIFFSFSVFKLCPRLIRECFQMDTCAGREANSLERKVEPQI